MAECRDYDVGSEDSGVRLDVFAARASGLTRSRVQRLIDDGHVRVNGRPQKARYAVAVGDHIAVEIPALVPLPLTPEAIPLDILFEDDDLLVLNKPPGLVVHPGAGRQTGTLVHALLAHCGALPGIGGVERPGIVHRLDRDTSGVMVVAKTETAHHALSVQFKARTTRKQYLAIVHGTIKQDTGKIDAAIGRREHDRKRMGVRRDGGRAARTTYTVVRRLPGMSVLVLGLETGRTHQIRVHLAHIGHPVVGDEAYGGRLERKSHAEIPRQMLHAWRLGFRHPRTGEWQTYTAPVPPDMVALLAGTTLELPAETDCA